VVLPSVRDPRLHLASVIITLQVLGQTVLDFEVSIAQILISIGTCVVLELVVTFWRRRIIAWPASAMLTGNGIAFLLRVPGTRHGDWWSTRGWWIFAGTAAVSLLSKYLLRVRGTHVFNPSNFGLVLCFVVLGSGRADPQDLWWGPWSPGLALTVAVILVGGLTILTRLRMLGMAIAFLVTFAACIGVVAIAGHCMTARWSLTPVCGRSFWWVVSASPEILVFTFFMITDPRTSPGGRVGRAVYGAAVAVTAAVLVAPQRSEFGTKVAILGALVIVCALVPVARRWLPSPGTDDDRVGPWLRQLTGAGRVRAAVVVLVIAGALGALLVAAGAHARNPSGQLAAADRPAVDVEVPPLPPVTIDGAVTRAAPSFDDAKAARLARDVAEGLALTAVALRTFDDELAAAAGAPAWADDLGTTIEAARRDGEIVVPSYTFDRAEVVLVRDPAKPQLPPRLALEASGTVRFATYSGEPGSTPGSEREEAFTATFVVVLAGDRYLLAEQLPAS
jgi:Na+-translocating ferredoxin:NAD+ oxidoreductase RnfD subunit